MPARTTQLTLHFLRQKAEKPQSTFSNTEQGTTTCHSQRKSASKNGGVAQLNFRCQLAAPFTSRRSNSPKVKTLFSSHPLQLSKAARKKKHYEYSQSPYLSGARRSLPDRRICGDASRVGTSSGSTTTLSLASEYSSPSESESESLPSSCGS